MKRFLDCQEEETLVSQVTVEWILQDSRPSVAGNIAGWPTRIVLIGLQVIWRSSVIESINCAA